MEGEKKESRGMEEGVKRNSQKLPLQAEREWAGEETRNLFALAEWGDWEWVGLVS